MEYRTLKDGTRVSILGFGCSPLGHEFGKIDEEEGIAAVKAALSAGINYFDTSPYYGRGRSEEVLGRALKGVNRSSFVVSTKVGRYDTDKFDFSADRVVASVYQSLQRLGLDYVDIVVCHDVEFGDLDQIINETIPALQRLREAGKLRLIGVSGLPLYIFKYILSKTNIDLILSYCHYTLLDTTLESIRPLLEEKKVSVINASPLAMGLLTHQGPPDWHPASSVVKLACRTAAAWCSERQVDLSQIALSFSLDTSRVCSTLIGMKDKQQVSSNIETATNEEIKRKCKAHLPAVLEILKPAHNLTWMSGRPENNGDIPLQ